MKRLLSLFLCLLLCLTLVPAARAEGSPVLAAAREGDDIVLTLSFSEDMPDLGGMHVRFGAPEGFAYDKATVYPGFTRTMNTALLDIVTDTTRVIPIAAGEPIITLYLTAPEDLQPGSYSFTMEILEAYDWDLMDYSFVGQSLECIYEEPVPAPVILQHPQSVIARVGDTAVFTVACDQETAEFCWYYRTGENAEWKASTGTGWNTDTLQVEGKLYRSGYQYRCEARTAGGSALSGAATLIVQQPPAIAAQPQSVTVKENETATFAVSASGTDLNYQWYYRTSESGTWSVSSSADAKKADFPVEAKGYRSGYQYRCEVSNLVGTVYSEPATLTVIKMPGIVGQPKSVTAEVGQTVNFTVKVTGGGISYQWYYRTSVSGSWSKCTNGTGETLSVEAKAYRNGYQYRCTVSNACGTLTSGTATLKVKQETPAAPVISAQPQSVTAAEGQTVSFTVTAGGSGLSYQWYYRTSASGTWNKSSNGTGATLSIEAKAYRSGYQYRCEVTNAGGSVTSEAATLTVLQAPAITGQPQSVTAEVGQTVSFTVKATGGNLSYQWYYRTSASGTWNKSSNGTGATLTVEAKSYRSGYQYRCVVTNSLGSATSSAATLTVN